MDIQTRKIEFLKLQSEEVISRFEKILRKENVRSEQEEFKYMSMNDSKNKRRIRSSELKAEIEEWN